MEGPNETVQPVGREGLEEILPLLVCPACHESLARQGDVLRCGGCGRGYPIRNGIPVLLVDEAAAPDAGSAGEGS